MTRRLLVGLFLLVPRLALANNVSDELGVGASQPTPTNPRSGYLYDRLGGEIDLSDTWDLRGDMMLTRDQPTPAQKGVTSFPSNGGLIPFLDLAVDWDPNDHLSFSAELDVSPQSLIPQRSDTALDLTAPGLDAGTSYADADLHSTNSSLGVVLTGGYDTAGDSNLETSLMGSVGVTGFSTTQNITAVEFNKKPISTTYLKEYCAANPTKANCKLLAPALNQESAQLGEVRLALTVTETVFDDTDLTLAGAYYVYSKDPTTIGYFTVATAGRMDTSFGGGLAIAPYQFTIRPDVSHRFGPLRLDLAYQYGQYVPGQGYSNQVALKLEYKFSKTFKLWVTGILEKDVDGTNTATQQGSIAAGFRYKF